MVMYMIYVLSIIIAGLICTSEGLDVQDWKYWVIIGCIAAAYTAGIYR